MNLNDVHHGIQKNKSRKRIGRGPGAQLRHPLAIDEHQAALDEGIGLASRAQAAFGQEF